MQCSNFYGNLRSKRIRIDLSKGICEAPENVYTEIPDLGVSDTSDSEDDGVLQEIKDVCITYVLTYCMLCLYSVNCLKNGYIYIYILVVRFCKE